MRMVILLIILVTAPLVFSEQEKFIYDDHKKRDPFWRLVTPGGTIITYEEDLISSELVLEGIIFDSAGKPLAIINGRIVTKGDRIGSFVVTEISEKEVTLFKGEEKFLLKLKKEEG